MLFAFILKVNSFCNLSSDAAFFVISVLSHLKFLIVEVKDRVVQRSKLRWNGLETSTLCFAYD